MTALPRRRCLWCHARCRTVARCLASASEPGSIGLAKPNKTPPNLQEVGVALPVGVYLRRLWARRDFVWAVPLGQLRAQTQSTVLGGAWHLLNPLLTAALYYFVFGILFKAAARVENYPAFLVVGVFTFLYTSRVAAAGAKSITSNIGLITQINFPRLALPVAATVAETISHGVALFALMGMLPVLGVLPSWGWLMTVPILLVQCLFNLGVAMVLARLAFQYRDIDSLLPHAIRLWMYASGLFFTVGFVVDAVGDGLLVTIFTANPAYIHMTLMRSALLDGEGADLGLWVGAAVWAAVAAGGGFAFFRSREVDYGRG
jgi:teichoic acid transport system permease protein